MRIPLGSSAKKIGMVAVSAVFAGVYLVASGAQYLAAYFSEKPDLASLTRAAKLQPQNAEYRYRVGRYLALVSQSPESALAPYRKAISLNPHVARYWLDLASAYQLLGKDNEQEDAVEHAIQVDPSTPNVAWETANLYLVQGDTDKALQQFRVVLESDPYLPPSALRLCWRVKPDIDFLLRSVIPANAGVYAAFLEILLSKGETDAAAKVWAQMAQQQQPIEKQHVIGYIHYLITKRDVDQARLVWKQASKLAGLSSYQPHHDNLLVNGSFAMEVLNGGFDWMYHKSGDVNLALDPTDAHTGSRSLCLTFDSRGIEDGGIAQLVPVEPDSAYDFSAFFKARGLQGAGGPRFIFEDIYNGSIAFASDLLSDTAAWTQVAGTFTTGPNTKLLLLRVQRFPAGDAIRGKLWIDDLRLVAGGEEERSQ